MISHTSSLLSLVAGFALIYGFPTVSEGTEPEVHKGEISASAPTLEIPSRLSFGEESWVTLGGVLQPIFIYNDSDWVRDDTDFRLRRARISVRGEAVKWAGFSLTTEGAGSGLDLIDGRLHLKPQNEIQFFIGRHLSPGPGRQAGTTSAKSLMAIDRPAFAFKNISYGGRALTAFATSTMPETDSGLRMDTHVRDEGVTFWGDHSPAENLHYKYYLGVYDGSSRSPARAEGDLRYSGRTAINFGDDESGFFNSSTYLGKKRTIGVGASFDLQNRVATEQGTGNDVHYRFWTVDFFVEQPVGPGVVNFEAAYGQLDFDDAGILVDRDGALFNSSGVSGRQAQGDGFYLQAGYYFPNLKIQPWAVYEEWESDAANRAGSYKNVRIGATYFARGQTLNFKIGYEQTRLDHSPNGDSTSDSVVTGAYFSF